MDELSVDIVSQLTDDELGEVLEEYTGVEFSDAQVDCMRKLIAAAGSLEGALGLLDEMGPSAEAA